jgi:hypothetical protein
LPLIQAAQAGKLFLQSKISPNPNGTYLRGKQLKTTGFAALSLLGSIWMHMPPKGWAPEACTTPPEKVGSGGKNFTIQEILRTPQFYLIFLTIAVIAGAGLMSIGLMKLYPMEALK